MKFNNYEVEDLRNAAPSQIRQVVDNNVSFHIFYHMTSTALLREINTKGLLTSRETGKSIVDGLPSDPDCVYLTSNKHEKHYLKRAVGEFGGKGMIVMVCVEIKNLLADENALPGAYLKESHDNQLFQSLCFNCCKHKGKIERNRIISIMIS